MYDIIFIPNQANSQKKAHQSNSSSFYTKLNKSNKQKKKQTKTLSWPSADTEYLFEYLLRCFYGFPCHSLCFVIYSRSMFPRKEKFDVFLIDPMEKNDSLSIYTSRQHSHGA